MGAIPWELVGAHAGSVVGGTILWGVLGALGGLAFAVGLSVLLSRVGALRVGFPGAGLARGALHGWIALVGLLAGGSLGAVHGGARGLEGIVRSPAFAGSALRPAAGPIAAGLAYTVSLQANVDPTPMLQGAAPIPLPQLRAVLGEPTGAALIAGLRRVPQLQSVAGSQTGGAVISLLAETLAGEHAAAVLGAAGLFDAMREMGQGLVGDGITIGALTAEVERTMLPAFVATWIGRLEGQVLASVAVPALVAILAAFGLLWAIEGIVRVVRRRPTYSSGAPSSSSPSDGSSLPPS